MPVKPTSFGSMLRGRKKPEGSGILTNKLERAQDEAQQMADAIRRGSRWRAVRADVLRREPLCRRCKGRGDTVVATTVDHIAQVTKRPDLAYDLANLQPLCTTCHGMKNADERRGARVSPGGDGGKGGGRVSRFFPAENGALLGPTFSRPWGTPGGSRDGR